MRERELAHRIGEKQLFFRECEVHRRAFGFQTPCKATRKRLRQKEASKLRFVRGGSVGLTRSSRKPVPLPARMKAEPAAISDSRTTVIVRRMPAPPAIFSRSTPRLVWLFCQPVSP